MGRFSPGRTKRHGKKQLDRGLESQQSSQSATFSPNSYQLGLHCSKVSKTPEPHFSVPRTKAQNRAFRLFAAFHKRHGSQLSVVKRSIEGVRVNLCAGIFPDHRGWTLSTLPSMHSFYVIFSVIRSLVVSPTPEHQLGRIICCHWKRSPPLDSLD